MSIPVWIMYLDRLVVVRERDLVVVKLCWARASVGELSPCYKIEGLKLDSLCDTPHVQVTVVAFQLPSKSWRVHDSIPMRLAQSSAALRHTGVRESNPQPSTTHSVKAAEYE